MPWESGELGGKEGGEGERRIEGKERKGKGRGGKGKERVYLSVEEIVDNRQSYIRPPPPPLL